MAPVPEREQPTEAGNARRAEAKRVDRIGWRLAGVGWEFSSQVLAGVLLGWGIDWFFETKPWGIVGGAAAGLSVGTLQFIRNAVKLNREMGPVTAPREGWKPVDAPKEPDEQEEGGPPTADLSPEELRAQAERRQRGIVDDD
jgi:F0F1-type ATP synthase assembly protein I